MARSEMTLVVKTPRLAKLRLRLVVWLFTHTHLVDGRTRDEARRFLRAMRWRVQGSTLGWVKLHDEKELISL